MTYWAHRVIDVYKHLGRIGVIVEFGCKTEFTASMAKFRAMTRDITLQIAAQAPETVEQLLEQMCIKNDSTQVRELLDEISQYCGESVAVIRFVRWTTEPTCMPFEEAPEPPRSPALIQKVG
jgi:elongation factor Ts